MITYLLIYVIGLVITFIVFKTGNKKTKEFDRSTSSGLDIMFIAGCLLLWPLTVIMFILYIMIIRFILIEKE
jgi:hypothetical protein